MKSIKINGVDSGYVALRNGQIVGKRGEILKPSIGTNGYLKLTIYFQGKKMTVNVHTIIAEAFLVKEDPFMIVNHKDGDKKNNTTSNLEWVSSSENVLHAYRTNLKTPSEQKTVFQLSTSGELMGEFPSIADASRRTGINRTKITAVVNGNRKTAGGFIWRSSEPKRRTGTRTKVLVFTNGEKLHEFNSISECARSLNISRTGISACLKGKQKTCGKYTFKKQ